MIGYTDTLYTFFCLFTQLFGRFFQFDAALKLKFWAHVDHNGHWIYYNSDTYENSNVLSNEQMKNIYEKKNVICAERYIKLNFMWIDANVIVLPLWIASS